MGVRKIHNGDVFSRLTVIKAYSSRINKKNYSLCRCICGNEKEINNAMLQNGTTRSCGCFQREQCRINVCKHNKTHGQSYTRLYRIWKDLVYRGVGKVNKKYYAEKGIKICKEWLSFYNFFDWANTHGYNDTLSIDRIDNKKGYSPENCRWATAREQANNRSTNRFICYRNKTETMANWSRILKVSYARVKYRANHNLDLATGEAL